MTGSVFASLSGDTASLTSHFNPELQLDNGSSYSCALTECHYTITPNIVEGKNNSLYFSFREHIWDAKVFFAIRVPSGYYTFERLSEYIEHRSTFLGHKMLLELDTTTMKTTIATYDDRICIEVREAHTDGIAPSLGFAYGFYCHAKMYESANGAKLWKEKTSKIRLDCDLTEGTYHNGEITHTIYEFDVAKYDYDLANSLDYKIVVVPRYPVYLPVNHQRISSINITAFDQRGEQLKLIDNESLHCWIHIRKDVDLSGSA